MGTSFPGGGDLSGGQDVFSVPLQMQYDTSKLSLINVDLGTFLGKDGQTVALVHRDDATASDDFRVATSGRGGGERCGIGSGADLPGKGGGRCFDCDHSACSAEQRAAGGAGNWITGGGSCAVMRGCAGRASIIVVFC